MEAAAPELNQIPPAAQMMQIAMGFIVSQSVGVAARLRLADHLKDGAKTPAELAALTGTHEPSLYRLLRALASIGVMRREADGSFATTELGDVLRWDHPQSQAAAVQIFADAEHWNAHGNMTHSVKTGGIAFDHTFGQPIFPWYQAHPEAASVFDSAMTSFSQTIGAAVVASYDFSGADTIADIGGGQGRLLAKVLETNPNARGILFEQPHVLEHHKLADLGIAERTETVGGDFFREVPVAADVYLMKFIIHDWNDEQSLSILKNLAASARPGSRLLLVEMVVEEDDNAPSASKIMDLNMLVMTGGRERTATEYARLLAEAGFELQRVIPTPSPVSIVEAVRT